MYINELLLDAIYSKNLSINTQHNYIEIKRIDIGDLHFSSGKIVAVDPELLEEYIAYQIAIQPGNYPVSIFVATDGNGDQRVAFTSIYLNGKKAIRWEMARFQDEGNEIDPYMEISGFGVDSGKAAILDQRVADQLLANDLSLDFIFSRQMEDKYVDTFSYSIGPVVNHSDSNEVIVFDSGWGDGCYPGYFGYDSEDNPCAFVIDCMILWGLKIMSQE